MKLTIYQAVTRNRFPMNIAALGIMFFGKTNYSHYVIKVEDQSSGEVFYYDSSGAGTRKCLPSEFKKKYTLTKSFQVSKEVSFIRWNNFWEKHVGKSYGFMQVLGLALKIFNIVRYNPFGAGAKRLICNELVILMLNEFGYTCIKDTDSLNLVETEEILKKVL